MKTAHVILFCSLGLCGWMAAAAPRVTTASLIEQMTDLRGLAEFPNPAFSCRQFSSYDPKSKSPGVDWFANGDAGHFLRVEERKGRKEYVLMEAEGPGAVVRVWSANPAGIVRIYIDEAEKPVIEAPLADLLGGKYANLVRPIAGEYSKGWNLYFPVPYAKHCKMTSDKGGFYYHVNYRTYEPGTAVDSFRLDELKTLAGRIEKLATQLSKAGPAAADTGAARWDDFRWEVPAGGSLKNEASGPAAFVGCVAKVTAPDLERALRGLIIRISFDGQPCVEVPFGDYFGAAPGLNTFSTLPVGVTKEGELYCNWYMPFKESAVVELVNHTSDPVTVEGRSGIEPYEWTGRSMHFHAKWRAQLDVPTRPMIDWNYLAAAGKGTFAGASFAIDNPVRDWWGEGDEKIYVDGEKFPSHFGTGTEDYYGYAWCWPGLFSHAYHSQPRCDGPGNYGRTSVNRFHILDTIPFTKQFRFDMELWHWHPHCKVNLAVTAWWYAQPGATDEFKPIGAGDAIVRPMPAYTPPRVAGALEGEGLKRVKVAGVAEPQHWGGLSGDEHLWWHAGMKPGDTLLLSFDVPRAGRYRLLGRFLSAKDYGIHQLAVNGVNASGPIDFYQPEVKPTSEKDLGTFDLKAGANQLSVTIVGANPRAVKSYMFGLDYIRLTPP